MRIHTLIIVIPLLLIVLGGGVWLASAGRDGSKSAFTMVTENLKAHEAVHSQIDQVVLEATEKFGYTNEAANAIVKKINEGTAGLDAQLTAEGNIDVSIPGEKMPRKILMNKPDLGGSGAK